MTIRSLNRNTNVIKRITKSRTAADLTRRRSIKQVIAGEGKPDFYIKWMIVGGGGEGGAAMGGGGGGGGIVIGINYLSPTGNLSYGVTYPVGVGGGGGYASNGRGGNGGDSSFLGFTAFGGGGGGGDSPSANTDARPGGSGGGSYFDIYGGSFGSQGGMGGVSFVMQYERPYSGYGSPNGPTQDGDGDRSGKNGNDSVWFDEDPTFNKTRNLNPNYVAPGPLVFRGYGGGGGGAAGPSFAPSGAGSGNSEGGRGGSGYAFGFENNFLQGPIANHIWGIAYGGGGSSWGYENNNRPGYNGPTPSVFPNAPGGVRTGFGSIRDAGDSWTGAPNWSPNGDGIGFDPFRGNPGEPWHNGPTGGFPPAGNSFRPFGWKSGYGENVSPGGPAPLPFSTPAGYYSMNGLPNSGQGGGGRYNSSALRQWSCRGPFWGSDSDNPGAPNWLGRAGANTGGKGGSGVVFLSYPQVFGNCSNTGTPDVYVTTDGFRVYTFRGSGSITIDYDPN
jgi:hypothetical protein